jgi:hypothetical protein
MTRSKAKPKPKATPKPPKVKAPDSWSALAETLGTSRQNLAAKKKKLGASAPPVTDVAAWEAIVSADHREGGSSPELRRKIGEQRLRLLTAAADREEIKRAKDKDQVIDRADVSTAIRKAMAKRDVLTDRFAELEGPALQKRMDEQQLRAALKEQKRKESEAFREALREFIREAKEREAEEEKEAA